MAARCPRQSGVAPPHGRKDVLDVPDFPHSDRTADEIPFAGSDRMRARSKRDQGHREQAEAEHDERADELRARDDAMGTESVTEVWVGHHWFLAKERVQGGCRGKPDGFCGERSSHGEADLSSHLALVSFARADRVDPRSTFPLAISV